MRLTLALELHFTRDPTGAIFGDGPVRRKWWDRYLAVFDEIEVLARVGEVDHPGDPALRADGDRIRFTALPDFHGPAAFARAAGRVWRTVGRSVARAEALVLRVPGTIGSVAAAHADRRGRPYAIEVVGDPWDSLAPGTVQSRVRPLVRGPMALALRRMARRAVAAAYVTRAALQARYPAGPHTYTTHYSSIELPEHHIVGVTAARRDRAAACAAGTRPWTLGFIGSFNVMYKAPDVHLEALAALRGRGVDARLELLGDGRHRAEMEALAARLGLAPHTTFHGRVPPGDPVNAMLDRCDLFLIASRTEGLPRALIEAMARGCPAIGSHVGGIPELLDDRWRVPAGDAAALADRIATALADPHGLLSAAERNAGVAGDYAAPTLRARRTAFYAAVAERSG